MMLSYTMMQYVRVMAAPNNQRIFGVYPLLYVLQTLVH